jgi:hypothetical protein
VRHAGARNLGAGLRGREGQADGLEERHGTYGYGVVVFNVEVVVIVEVESVVVAIVFVGHSCCSGSRSRRLW